MDESLSRRLGRFAGGLTYSDLPPAVIDKAKACLLHALAAGLAGSTTPGGQAAIKLAKEEEGREGGATILVDGSRATRMGAAFANSQLMRIPEQWDTYRMLTHPGLTIVPAALATAEVESSSGKDLLVAMVAGYETLVRLAGDFIPSTQARGFRSSAAYGVFGAATATGRLLGLGEDQMVAALALAATFAAGTLEGQRMRTGEMAYHEPSAARNGILAALLARKGTTGAETALEGEAGFYFAFTGSNKGELPYVFTGPNRTDLSRIVEGLGQRYEMLNICFKIYPTAGFNIPIVALMAFLKKAHDIRPEQVERIALEMNWLETLMPSPVFPAPALSEPTIGSKQYFAAYTCVEGDYPLYGTPRATFRALEEGYPEKAAQILEVMRKITIVGVKERTFFAPKMDVAMKDGKSYRGELTGEELKWGLEEEIRRIRGLAPWLPIPEEQFDELITTVREVERLDTVDRLLQLTQPR
ncbi:MAG: MmgE/PrpD family protein [Chloroflexota bacterium]|nr:MmgE/PrpD family protein [Chloroflexota bacterium]